MTDGFKIEVPSDYFARTAAREYADDAGLAVIREFAQNACDAGARNVRFTFTVLDGVGAITCEDDGRGCSAETLRTKVLRPLESQKGADAVGGFGKAKELLYFANPSWRIQTGTCDVQGSFLTVSSFTTDAAPFAGFRATVHFPIALYRKARDNASDFMQSSERPGITWWLNGQPIECRVKRGPRAVKDFGFAKAYRNKDTPDSYLYLRTGGLLTGKRYCYHGGDVGRIVMEITGASTDLLTPARDNFRSFDHRSQVDGWLNALVTDARKVLAEDVGDEIVFFDDAALALDLPDVQPEDVKPPARIHAGDVMPAVNGITAEVSFLSTGPAVMTDGTPGPALPVAARKGPNGFDMARMPRIPGVSRVTVHTGGKDRAKEGGRWLKANAYSARRLLAAWFVACREIAAANRLPLDAVGFCFAADAEAEYVKSGPRFALLVNPLTFDFKQGHALDEILDLASHEIAHLATSGCGHNEVWSSAQHTIRRATRDVGMRQRVARAWGDGAVPGPHLWEETSSSDD